MKKLTTTLKPTLLALSLALTAPLVLTGCGEATASVDTETKAEEVIKVPVETTLVTRGDIANYYSANAILESVEEADVIAKVHGLIENVLVEEGDYVEKGQVLAEIDATRYQIALQQRQAELKRVKGEFDRLSSASTKSLVSADQLEKLEWQYKSLEASTNLAALEVKEAKEGYPPMIASCESALFCDYYDTYEIPGKTTPVILEVKHQFIEDDKINERNHVNIDNIGRCGVTFKALVDL